MSTNFPYRTVSIPSYKALSQRLLRGISPLHGTSTRAFLDDNSKMMDVCSLCCRWHVEIHYVSRPYVPSRLLDPLKSAVDDIHFLIVWFPDV